MGFEVFSSCAKSAKRGRSDESDALQTGKPPLLHKKQLVILASQAGKVTGIFRLLAN